MPQISDFKHSPKLAYRELEGHDILYWTTCSWHFHENLKKNLTKKLINHDEFKWIGDMQRTSSQKVFKWMWDKYIAEHPDGTWFTENYG